MIAGAWIVIPSQGFTRGKSRLAPVLDPEARRAFSRAAFRRVLHTARVAVGPRRVLVVSRSPDALSIAVRMGVRRFRERRADLNAALTEAVRHARRRGARAVVVIHADLPEVRVADVKLLVRALERSGVVIAPDREGTGTNALGMRLSKPVRFRFGAGSFARHKSGTKRVRRRAKIVRSPGLGRDVDTPEDYAAFVAAQTRYTR